MYECDAYNDDIPYYVSTPNDSPKPIVKDSGLLIIPYTLEVNDMKFSVSPGFGTPGAYFDYLKNAFDILYEEGCDGSPKMMSVGMHCRIVGRPGRAMELQRFLEYVESKSDVWVCTRKEIAEHWRKEFPYLSK